MGDRRPSRWQDEDSESEHEKIIHIQCWIPGEGIDLTVLASYLKEYIDDTATIRQSRSPQDRYKTGFTISAQATISVEGLRDLIKDSKNWAAETKSREYRTDPYPYTDSDTWISRKRSGPTPGHKNPRQRRRRAAAVDRDTENGAHYRSLTRDLTLESRHSDVNAHEDRAWFREYFNAGDGICDGAVWLSWTRHIRGERLFEPNIADPSQNWPPCSIQERCGAELLASARGRSWLELNVLFKTLHVAATAQDRLHEEALYEAVMIDMGDGEGASDSFARISAKGDITRFMSLCQGLLSTATDGGVEFRMRGMRHFLLRSNLPEVGDGHETISRICLRKLKDLASMLVVRPWTGFRQLLGRCSPLSLVDYVLRYWPLHYRLSESLANDMPALLHQTIEVAVEHMVSNTMQHYEIELRRETLNVGLYMCDLYGFTVLHGIYKHLGASYASSCFVQSWFFQCDISQVHAEPFDILEIRNSLSEGLWTDLTTSSDASIMCQSAPATESEYGPKVVNGFYAIGRDSASYHELILTESKVEDLSRDVCRLQLCHSSGTAVDDTAERWVFIDALDAAASPVV